MSALRTLSRPVARSANPAILLHTKACVQSRRGFSSTLPVAAPTAIVTGAARGIGKAIALRLARDGFNICANDISVNKSLLEETVSELSSANPDTKATGHVADVRSAEAVNDLVADAVETLGPLNVMVANAGVVCATPLVDISDEEHRRMFDINYFGTNNCYRAAAKQFIKQGKPEQHPPIETEIGAKPVGSKGVYKLIGCASIAALRPAPLIGPYSTSKWAVRGLTHAWALELAQYGITANSYAPGIVGTAMWDVLDDKVGSYFGMKKGEYTEGVLKSIALGRTSVPEDVSSLVSFLAGKDSDYMTGQMIAVDGGSTYS